MNSKKPGNFILLFLACIGLSLWSIARGDTCRVLDPELVGEYFGDCADGLADGFGVATGISRYEGRFVAGMKHGPGVKTWPNGDRFEGVFKADMREGRGLYRWGAGSNWSGDFYLGSYLKDKRHGRGLYEWANGDRFEGEWKEDLRYGYSAKEIQRQRAKAAWAAYVANVPSPVCADFALGLASHFTVRGAVEGLQDERLTLKVLRVDGAVTNTAAGSPSLGDYVSLVFSEAYPCTLE